LKMANRPYMSLAILESWTSCVGTVIEAGAWVAATPPKGDRRVGHEQNGLVSIPTAEPDVVCDEGVVTNSFQNPGSVSVSLPAHHGHQHACVRDASLRAIQVVAPRNGSSGLSSSATGSPTLRPLLFGGW
jgi:hypothetical protein